MRKPKYSINDFQVGETVLYKKNGTYGSYESVIASIGKTVRIFVKSWCGSMLEKPYYANVKPSSIRKLIQQ